MKKLILILLGFFVFFCMAEPEPVTPFEKEIQKASKAYGVKSAIIKGIIKQESAFNPNAVSHAGARELMSCACRLQLGPGKC